MHYEKFQDGTKKCIEDEIPFELPAGWVWTHLSDIVTVLNGDRGQNYPAKSKLQHKGIPFVSASNIEYGIVATKDLLCLSESQYNALGAGKLIAGDIVYCIRGSLGKCGVFTMEKGAIASSLVIVRPMLTEATIADYVFLYLNSAIADGEIKKYDNGSAQPNLAAKDFKRFLIPIPPLNEMHRISIKIKEAFSFVQCVQSNKDKLAEIVTKTKSKILDLAIRGKLVPQNPYDEPASMLLEHIREKKEALIKTGKLKRDKKESIIFRGEDNSYYHSDAGNTEIVDDLLPYELPDSWRWCRICDVFSVNPRNHIDNETEVSFVPMPLIADGYSNHFTCEIKRWKDVKSGFTHFQEGDIGLAKITPCFENRKSVVFTGLTNAFGAGTTELHILRPLNECIDAEYAMWFLKSEQFIRNGVRSFTGAVGQQRIGRDVVANTFFPLPPIIEQKRIVKKIHMLFDHLDLISCCL